MSAGIQALQTPSTEEEGHPVVTHPIAPEDLATLGVESELIPFIPIILQVERSPDDLPQLSPEEKKNLVGTLCKVLSSTTNPKLERRCFGVLCNVSPTHATLPPSYFLPGVELTGAVPHTPGGFADIWKGQWDGNQVCVKAFRIEARANPDKVKRRLYRKIVGWKSVSHPYVLPFLGVSEELFPFCIISPWLPNEDIVKYIRKNEVDRLQLLAQAASGLGYLHSLSIVHSNITPGNILITEKGTACLGGVGVTGAIADPTGMGLNSMTTSEPAAVRYMAPELLDPLQASLTRRNPPQECDIYSLAMTAFEILSDVLPYGKGRESVIAYKIVEHQRPVRPDTPTAKRWLLEPIWVAIQGCWDKSPQSRLSLDLLLQAFVGSDPGQMEGIPVTGNGGDTATANISRSTADSSPESSPLKEEKPAQSEQPSAKPPSERPGTPVQPPLVKRNPLETILAGIRRVGVCVFCRGRR